MAFFQTPVVQRQSCPLFQGKEKFYKDGEVDYNNNSDIDSELFSRYRRLPQGMGNDQQPRTPVKQIISSNQNCRRYNLGPWSPEQQARGKLRLSETWRSPENSFLLSPRSYKCMWAIYMIVPSDKCFDFKPIDASNLSNYALLSAVKKIAAIYANVRTIYIGKAKRMRDRKGAHISSIRHAGKDKNNTILYQSIRELAMKTGCNFRHKAIIYNINPDVLKTIETQVIKIFKSHHSHGGWNSIY